MYNKKKKKKERIARLDKKKWAAKKETTGKAKFCYPCLFDFKLAFFVEPVFQF